MTNRNTYNGWEVRLVEVPGKIGKALHIFRMIDSSKIEHWRFDGVVEIKPVGEAIEPTLYVFTEQLQALALALNESGVKLPEKAFVEGKLEATERHLSDMRKMLKLK